MRKLSYTFHLLIILSFLLFTASHTPAQSKHRDASLPDTSYAIALFGKAKEAMNNGRFDSIGFWIGKALPIFKSSKQWEYQVRSYHVLCGVNYKTRKNQLAEQFLDSALQILTIKTDSSDHLYAPYYHNRATVAYVSGDYETAKKYFFEAIDIYNRYPADKRESIISSYNNLGLSFSQLRDHENAVTFLEKCLELNLRYNAENEYLIGRNHNNLGMAYFQKGHSEAESYGFDFNQSESYQKAENHYQKALDNYLAVLSPPNIALGQCYLNLATVASAQQKIDQCSALSKQALINFGEGSDNPSPEIVEVYYNLSIAFKIAGQLDSSRYYINKAIRNGKFFFGEKHPYLSDFYNYLGRVNMMEKRPEDALKNFQHALIIASINFDDTIFTHNPLISKVLLEEEAMNNFAWKAMAFKEKFNKSHNPKDMEMVVENYYLFDDMVRVILNGLSNEEAKLTFMQSIREIYGDMLEICYRAYVLTSNPKYLEDALYFSDNEKSATLSAYIDNLMAEKYTGMSTEEIEIEKIAREKQLYFENEFNNLRLANVTDSNLIAAVSDSLLQARYQIEKIAIGMEGKHKKLATLKEERQDIKIADLQSLLAFKNATAIEFFLMDTALYIIAVSPHDFGFHKTIIDTNFFNQIADFRKSISDYHFIADDAKTAYQSYTQNAAVLYKVLFPDVIRPVLETASKIIVIPSGELNYLSFDCLLSKEANGKAYKEMDYLANDYIVSYANAIRYITTETDNKSPDRNYAGFAPEYDQTILASNMEPDEYAVFRDSPGLLREHSDEVKYAGEVFDGDVFLGKEASEWNFKQASNEYNILHFAMHAQINDLNPLSSKFLFSQVLDAGSEDNFLNTHEIYMLDLNARLVVLSACNTASGIIRKGEGVMSLSRAFMYSGVSSIVSSLWLAEDHASNKIMSGFFDGVSQGLPIDEALQLSRKNYLKTADPVFSHPYYWANFIMTGNNDPVKRISIFPYITAGFIMLVGLLIFGLVYFGYRRRRSEQRVNR